MNNPRTVTLLGLLFASFIALPSLAHASWPMSEIFSTVYGTGGLVLTSSNSYGCVVNGSTLILTTTSFITPISGYATETFDSSGYPASPYNFYQNPSAFCFSPAGTFTTGWYYYTNGQSPTPTTNSGYCVSVGGGNLLGWGGMNSGGTMCTPTVATTYYTQACSASNACGSSASGYCTTSGGVSNGSCPSPHTCSVSSPSLPSGYGSSCTSSANSCGQTSTGTIQCNGSCSASTPANPSYYGASCSKTSSANACGQTTTTTGTYNCSDVCTAPAPSTPSNPSGYGSTCYSAYNACGQRNAGTIQCNGTCSASTPSTSSCPAPSTSVSESPNPVVYGASPTFNISSPNGAYCALRIDWGTAGVPADWSFGPGNVTGPSNLSPGSHQVEAICYNSTWTSYGNGWATANFTVSNPPTSNISVSPNPVPYGQAPVLTLSSTNAYYCYEYIDWTYGTSGYFTSGIFYGPSNLSSGGHQAESYCYNSAWKGSGWTGTNFTVGAAPPNPAGGAVSPTVATVGVPVSLVGAIKNTGPGSTVTSFPNWFIVRNGANGSGSDVFDNNIVAPALASGVSESITDPSYAFPSAGTYSAVVCAGYDTNWNRVPSNSSGGGCGSWVNISVQALCYGQGCTNYPPGGSGSTCNASWSGQPKLGTPSQCCSTTPGVCPDVPSCSLTASPSDVNVGDQVGFTWSCVNATSCTALPTSAPAFNTHGAANNSGVPVVQAKATQSGTTSYGIECTGPGGTKDFISNPVTVHQPTCTLSANPTRVVSGGTVSLTVNGTDVKGSCTVSSPGLPSKTVPVSNGTCSSTYASPAITTQTQFTLTCGTYGSAIVSPPVTVNVQVGFQNF